MSQKDNYLFSSYANCSSTLELMLSSPSTNLSCICKHRKSECRERGTPACVFFLLVMINMSYGFSQFKPKFYLCGTVCAGFTHLVSTRFSVPVKDALG